MNHQDQFTLSLMTACLMQQSQMLNLQDAMLRELMDRVESVGDLLWRMDRGITPAPVHQATARKQPAKKRHPAPHAGISRKRRGK